LGLRRTKTIEDIPYLRSGSSLKSLTWPLIATFTGATLSALASEPQVQENNELGKPSRCGLGYILKSKDFQYQWPFLNLPAKFHRNYYTHMFPIDDRRTDIEVMRLSCDEFHFPSFAHIIPSRPSYNIAVTIQHLPYHLLRTPE
jgi:hypothetical protein